MNELMTMEEFDSALRALFFRQCESALSELHIDEVPESKDVTANSVIGRLYGLANGSRTVSV